MKKLLTFLTTLLMTVCMAIPSHAGKHALG